jgi:hypothetical protein
VESVARGGLRELNHRFMRIEKDLPLQGRLRRSSLRKGAVFIRIAVPPSCTRARIGLRAIPSAHATPTMPSRQTIPTSRAS